jgi:hypothetical protein
MNYVLAIGRCFERYLEHAGGGGKYVIKHGCSYNLAFICCRCAKRTCDISSQTFATGTVQINMEGESGRIVVTMSCPILRSTTMFGNPRS